MSDPTNAERQARWKQRQRDQGKTEVRGIWANPARHEAIKRFAAQMEEDEDDRSTTD